MDSTEIKPLSDCISHSDYLSFSKYLDTKPSLSVKQLMSLKQYTQKSPEWMAWRKKCITGSIVSNIIPKSERFVKYYVDLFKIEKFKYDSSKTCGTQTYDQFLYSSVCEPHFFSSSAMDFGNQFEPCLRNAISVRLNTEIVEPGGLPSLRHPFIGGSPDGLLETKSSFSEQKVTKSLEIKTVVSRKLKGYPPIYYFLQAEMVAYCLNLKEFIYAEGSPILMNEVDWLTESEEWSIEAKPPHQFGIHLYDKLCEDKQKKYVYPPQTLRSPNEFLSWKNDTMSKNHSLAPVFYKIEILDIHHLTVRNDYTETLLPLFLQVLDQISRLQGSEVYKTAFIHSFEEDKKKKRLVREESKTKLFIKEHILEKKYLGRKK